MNAQLLRAAAESRVLNLCPGCSLTSSASEMMHSYEKVASLLGFQVSILEDWSCCGSTPAHNIHEHVGVLLAARNLLLAESSHVEELLTLCPSCFVRLWDSREKLLKDQKKNERLRECWGKSLEGSARPVFFWQKLVSASLENLHALKRRCLAGLKIAPYFGCLLSRQSWITGLEGRSTRPSLSRLLKSLGAVEVGWALEEQCCGAALAVTKPYFSQKLVARIHRYALRAGASSLLVFCPLCHMNLELRAPSREGLPVLNFTELLALAAGIPDVQRWLGRHLVDPRPALSACGIL